MSIIERGPLHAGHDAPLTVPDTPASLIEPESDPEPEVVELDTVERTDQARGPTRVCVAHGDVRFARHHVLAGHYLGRVLSSGERALDQLVDGHLARAAQIGIYPGLVETSQIFAHADSWAPPRAVIIAGLGRMGSLSAAGLSRTITHAVLAAALAQLDGSAAARERVVGGVRQLCLSTLLVGSGRGGLSVRECVQALLSGILRANDRLEDTGLAVHVAEFEVIELWQDRALQAVGALASAVTTGGLAGSFALEPRMRELPGRQRRLVFDDGGGWWQRVRVRTEPDGSLAYETAVRRAGAPTRTVCTQRALVDRLVESLVDSPSPDPSAARTLFELLLPNDLKIQSPDTDNLVLVVDEGSAHYPWELLDDHMSRQEGRPLGLRRGIIRQFEGASVRSESLLATGNRALVIGDTLSDQPPLPAAQQEAKAVAEALSTDGYDPNLLVAESGTRIVQSLFDAPYRIVHLAGHGVYRWSLDDGTEATVTGMMLGNGMFLTAAEIGQMRDVPELVFVNCCHLGANVGTAAPSSGVVGLSAQPGLPAQPSPGQGGLPAHPELLDSPNYHRLAADFATELINIGVRAVVACGWAVDDEAAATFARTFYDAFVGGATLGDSIARARGETYDRHDTVNTWGAYQCYGDPEYRLAREDQGWRPAEYERPATLEQTRVAIHNLSQAVDVSRDTGLGLRRLKELIADLSESDLTDCDLQALVARTFNRFGDFPEARAHFERTLESGGCALTVQDFEVWVDQQVRAAAALAGAPDADEAAATIRSGIDTLGRLLNPADLILRKPATAAVPRLPEVRSHANVDRCWRLGSAYQRLALVTSPDRPGATASLEDWAQTQEALVEMSRWFDAARHGAQEATGPGHGRGARRLHGALASWLVAELALRWHPLEGRDRITREAAEDLLTRAVGDARTEAYRAPSFWAFVGWADLVVVEALNGSPQDDEAPAVLRIYREAATLGTAEQLEQVGEQFDFLLAMAGRDAHARRRFLESIRDALRELSRERTSRAGD